MLEVEVSFSQGFIRSGIHCRIRRWAYHCGLLLLLILPIGVHSQPTTTHDASPLQVGIHVSGMPWSSNTADQQTGLIFDILNATFAELNIPVAITQLPATRLIASLYNERLDAALTLSNPLVPLTTELPCSDPMVLLPFGLFMSPSYSPPGNSAPDSSETAKLPTFGMLRLSHLNITNSTSLASQANIVSYSNTDQMFRAYKAGRIDGVIATPLITNYWRNQLQLQLEPKRHLGHLQINMCFSPPRLGHKANELAKRFNRAYFSVIDSPSATLPDQLLNALRQFDGREPPKTVLQVE